LALGNQAFFSILLPEWSFFRFDVSHGSIGCIVETFRFRCGMRESSERKRLPVE